MDTKLFLKRHLISIGFLYLLNLTKLFPPLVGDRYFSKPTLCS